MLVGIYSTMNNIMDFINDFQIEKTQEWRKNKQKVTKVEATRVDKEEHERRKKNPHSRNPKRVTFENEETPNEYFIEIGPNEVITPSCKIINKINKRETWMMIILFLLIMKK